eukprot:scaffold79300_cov18-Prasinocladus_malaysianus.AAC.1
MNETHYSVSRDWQYVFARLHPTGKYGWMPRAENSGRLVKLLWFYDDTATSGVHIKAKKNTCQNPMFKFNLRI